MCPEWLQGQQGSWSRAGGYDSLGASRSLVLGCSALIWAGSLVWGLVVADPELRQVQPGPHISSFFSSLSFTSSFSFPLPQPGIYAYCQAVLKGFQSWAEAVGALGSRPRMLEKPFLCAVAWLSSGRVVEGWGGAVASSSVLWAPVGTPRRPFL